MSALLPTTASPQPLEPQQQASANGSLVSPPPHPPSDAWLVGASQFATPSAHAMNDTGPAGGSSSISGGGGGGGGSKPVKLVPLYCAVMGLVIVCVVIYAIWKQHRLRVCALSLSLAATLLCSDAAASTTCKYEYECRCSCRAQVAKRKSKLNGAVETSCGGGGGGGECASVAYASGSGKHAGPVACAVAVMALPDEQRVRLLADATLPPPLLDPCELTSFSAALICRPPACTPADASIAPVRPLMPLLPLSARTRASGAGGEARA